MDLQRFLREGGTPAQLFERFAIKTARHPEFPSLALFKYHQIDSPFGQPIVRESRGVILDEAREWAVVSRPFDKFFNYGEGNAAPIDWGSARVQEKLDGSLCVLYHHEGWRVATSGTPDAGGNVNGFGIKFRDLFWRVFEALQLELPRDEHLTFMFELTAPENRVVVRHQTQSLTLIGVRCREDGLERDYLDRFGYPSVRSFPLQSIADVVATFADISPLSQEGYVIVDGAFNRIKVKHPGYVALHNMRDGFGSRRVVELIRTDAVDEVLSYFPEYRSMIEPVRARFAELAAAIDAEFIRLRHIPVQKDFALEAVKQPFSGALFALRAGKAPSGMEFLRGMNMEPLLRQLGIKGEEQQGSEP